MSEARTFPHGVTSWVDVDLPDVDAGITFYSALFGWTFADATPPDAPFRYVIAQLGGRDVAAIGGPSGGPARWNTYVAVDDADDAAARFVAAGATLVSGPLDAGPGGRTATLLDPEGAAFRLWQARRRLGVQVANEPGAWNFSNLHTADPRRRTGLLRPGPGLDVRRRGVRHLGLGARVRRPPRGHRRPRHPDPSGPRTRGVRRRGRGPSSRSPRARRRTGRSSSPSPTGTPRSPRSSGCGGVVVSTAEDQWVRRAVVRDPQGAELVVSQFAPQAW